MILCSILLLPVLKEEAAIENSAWGTGDDVTIFGDDALRPVNSRGDDVGRTGRVGVHDRLGGAHAAGQLRGLAHHDQGDRDRGGQQLVGACRQLTRLAVAPPVLTPPSRRRPCA